MIKKLQSIENINEYKFLNGNLIVLTQKGIENLSLNKRIDGEFYCIRPWNNFLLTQNKTESNILIYNEDLTFLKEHQSKENYALWLLNDCRLLVSCPHETKFNIIYQLFVRLRTLKSE